MTTRRKRVLLVDDDASVREPVRFALESVGYDVLTASDGTEGLARIESDAPDLVVLDLVMPRRSGFAVLERLGQLRTGRPKVVFVTGNDEPRHREHAAARGADVFLPKPFDMDQLVATVDALLAGPPPGD